MRSVSVLVDGHVHYHPEYDAGVFVEGLAANLSRARRSGGAELAACVWLLSIGGDDAMTRLQRDLAARAAREYRFEPTLEPCSLLLKAPSGPLAWLVAGRQYRTREDLEVLAIGSGLSLEDDTPIADLLSALASQDVLTVLPWGVGRWWARRGRVLQRLLAERRIEQSGWYVGDNGNRPRFWRRPDLFARAEAAGVWDLPGSDPLPDRAQQRRAGSYGFLLQGDWDARYPLASLRRSLAGLEQSPARFGDLTGSLPFVRAQAAAQWRKWRSRRR